MIDELQDEVNRLLLLGELVVGRVLVLFAITGDLGGHKLVGVDVRGWMILVGRLVITATTIIFVHFNLTLDYFMRRLILFFFVLRGCTVWLLYFNLFGQVLRWES